MAQRIAQAHVSVVKARVEGDVGHVRVAWRLDSDKEAGEMVALEIKAGDVLTVTADAGVTIELRPTQPCKSGAKALAHLELFVEPIVPKGSYK